MLNISSQRRLIRCVFVLTFLLSFADMAKASQVKANQVNTSDVGAEQYTQYFPLLTGKKIGVVVNQTSRVQDKHLVDVLTEHQFDIKAIFAPEHGFRGDHSAGEKVSSSIDSKTGINIVSIYGKHKKPTDALMAELDVIIFDIQDVGVRFYTYISSMHYMMQAAAENNVEFIVLDRPNPNIKYVDGPMLEPEFRSFVGMHPIPLSHGMTVGELAKMILGEGWLAIKSTRPKFDYKLQLTVIPVKDYHRSKDYILPIAPSPNLPNQQAINLYPSLCLFEATPISVGRGTKLPFQVLGHNTVIDTKQLGAFTFTPKPIKQVSKNPKLNGQLLTGQNLSKVDIKGFDLSLFFNWYQVFEKNKTEFFQRPDFMDKLAGTDKLRKSMLAGQSLTTIKQSWQAPLNAFLQQRKPYLLY